MGKEITYTEIIAQSALNKLKRKIPYGWDLNIYRGCQHGCRYCYALYSHGYLSSEEFSREIFIKTNLVETLEKELQSPGWEGDVINIGGVTDSYQPAEEKYRLMPQILRLLIKYKNPAIISTKSALILRDYDLIDELSRITYINVAATITTVDSTTEARFAMLKEFRKTNASLGLHVMPIIPFLTDSETNFEALFSKAKDCSIDYLLPGTLYLRGKTRAAFFKFIEEDYPEKLDQLRSLYITGAANKDYKDGLYKMVNRLRDKYGLSKSYMKPMREKLV